MSRLGRAAGWSFVAAGVAGGIVALVAVPLSFPASQWWGIAPILALAAGTVAAGYRFGVMPRIIATTQAIVVQNPLRRIVVPLVDVDDVAPS